MITRLLIADPNAAFAMMVKQVLEDTGEYQVSVVNTGAEAVQAAAAEAFDLAVVDMDLPDLPAVEVIGQMRAAHPRLAIMAIPVDSDDAHPDLAGLDLQGTLTKPFFIPELPALIEAALTQPVGGEAPPPRVRPVPQIVAPGSRPAAPRPSLRERLAARGSHKSSDVPPPPWLLDVNKAAQYLTRLSLETAAEAALITRGDRLWAYAGHFSGQPADELRQLVVESWARDGGSGSVAKFVRLSEGHQYFMLYSMPMAADFVLSLAFQAETPIGMIRKQARKLAEALVQRPPAEPPPPEPTAGSEASPVETSPAAIAETESRPAAEVARTAPPVEVEPEANGAIRASAASSMTGLWPDGVLEPPTFPRTADFADPAQPFLTPEAPADLDLRAPASPPATAPAGIVGGFEHVPGALYQLTYTFVMLPKLPRYRMAGDLAVKLDEWLRHYAVIYHWRVDRMSIHPNYAVLVITCPPTTAPERVLRSLRRLTSERIAAEFTRVMHDDPSGDFWARPYLLFNADHDPDLNQIADFITQVRQQQGLIG